MSLRLTRRQTLATLAAATASSLVPGVSRSVIAAKKDPKWEAAIDKGLKWMAKTQSSAGHWHAGGTYPTAMTSLAGTALVSSGSTTTQGPYAKNIQKAVNFLMGKRRGNGLIGDTMHQDNRYTYGHGFAMLFLSQVLGEEEDAERREELSDVLTKAVDFSCKAQATTGGWGYVSAKDQPNFDEGSTTITQVQGLRACRNAGIVVPGEAIDKAKEYIYGCKNADGGISYSSRNRGSSRPAITAAALASLYNAGDYESKHIPDMLEFCKKNLKDLSEGPNAFGHWHYTYLYYSQVMYRQGEKEWGPFRDKLYNRIVSEQQSDGSWVGQVAPIYVTSCNLIMLQLDKAYLPIYQR
jgi:hypothetical protein